MNTLDAYDVLYSNMKNRFTVVNENSEYTLGEYMLMKSGAKKEKSNLPIVNNNLPRNNAITAVFRYVNDKLTVKKAPVKDKIIKSFPFRTSFAALASAVLACTLLISYGSVAINGVAKEIPSTVEVIQEETDFNDIKNEK